MSSPKNNVSVEKSKQHCLRTCPSFRCASGHPGSCEWICQTDSRRASDLKSHTIWTHECFRHIDGNLAFRFRARRPRIRGQLSSSLHTVLSRFIQFHKDAIRDEVVLLLHHLAKMVELRCCFACVSCYATRRGEGTRTPYPS